MRCVKIKEQYIYCLSSEKYTLFYNNVNGQIAYAKCINSIDDAFFIEPNDTKINLNNVAYEQLYLAVSESCNFRCKYCRQHKSGALVNMSIDDIKNAIDTFYSVSSTPKSVVFFGGEPLLNIKGIQYAIDYIKGIDSDMPFSMVINGSLCTNEIANYLAKNDVEVIVSLDGPENLHNKARVYLGGNGTYKEALQGYLNLKNAGCTTGITTVIGPHNEKHFDELIAWASNLVPNSLGFCLPHGDNNNYAMNITSFEEAHKEMIRAFDVLHKEGIYIVQVEQKLKAFLLGYSIPFECKACGKRIVACKDRRFGICEGPITNKDMFLNNIEGLKKIVATYKKTSPFLIDSCRSCIAYRICGGSCVYDKLTRFGRVDIPDECRCGLNIMIAERAMTHILENIVPLQESHILTTDERNSFMCTLTAKYYE